MFKSDAESCFPSKPRSIKMVSYGLLLSLTVLFGAQPATPQKTSTTPAQTDDISGMYSFEREGEFVQITVEHRTAGSDAAKPLAVTGYISRFADSESDSGAFFDYFISKGTLEGDRIEFTTKTVHGIFYKFAGRVARGATATRDKDGYYEIRGKLTQSIVQGDTSSSKSRDITMKLYPDIDAQPAKKKD